MEDRNDFRKNGRMVIRFETPEERRLDEAGLQRMINTPYAGTFVPNAVLRGHSSCDLVSVMLEFNRRVYCDERGNVSRAKAERIRQLIRRIVCDCADLDSSTA